MSIATEPTFVGEDLPVILVVDDAHRADPAAVALLGSLPGEEARLLVVATARSDMLAVQATQPGTFGHALSAWIDAGAPERHDLERADGSGLRRPPRDPLLPRASRRGRGTRPRRGPRRARALRATSTGRRSKRRAPMSESPCPCT